MASFDKLQFKRGTASEWAAGNPILASGEPGFDITNHLLKVGDGVNPWSVLPYLYTPSASGMQDIVEDTTPQLGGDLDLNSNDVIGVGNISITGNGTVQNLTSTGDTILDDVISVRTLSASGNIVTSGDVTAAYFHGDGSQLTNLPNPSASLSGNLTSNINLAGYSVVGSGDVNISGTISNSGNLVLSNNGHIQLPAITNGNVPAHQEGIIFFDDDTHSLSYYNDVSDMTLNVGQEFIIRVRNNTGSTITNGQAVYINGAHGNATPTVALAVASGEATSHVAGVATHDISDASFGYVTSRGMVNGVNTSSFSPGDELFLSSTVAGGLTSTEPSIPNYKTAVAHVVNSHVSAGSLYIEITNPKLAGGDMKSNSTPSLSGIPFVAQAVGDAGALDTDQSFYYHQASGTLYVNNIVVSGDVSAGTIDGGSP